MYNKNKLLLVGKVVGVHGVRGEIKIFSYGDCDKKPWRKLYLSKGEDTVICEVTDNRPYKGVILTSIKGYDNRNHASKLVGFDVFLEKTTLPVLPDDEYYHFQLEGIEVITDYGKTIGVITHIFLTGSNDVYVVEGPKGEVLIPAVSHIVLKVDINNKKMIVHMPEGLEDR
ncbi:MAG: 16S rRNA processing protein RimM [Deltaproteobacteria bacterium]|nr:16S rRNA processing protein RimM [Deltaproteobacteria bacterium]